MRRGENAMKKALFVFLATASAAFLAADEGAWSETRGYTPAEGALYSTQGNTDIALEKEYLELGDFHSGETRAIFQFRNTSTKTVVVECAFPILLSWTTRPLLLDGSGRATETAGPGVVRGWDFGETDQYGHEREAGRFDATIEDWLDALGIPWKTWEIRDPEDGGRFIAESDWPKGRKEFPVAAFADIVSPDISQDGKAVTLANCVVDYGEGPGSVTLHFRHKLAFPANSLSIVQVYYSLKGLASLSFDPNYSEGSFATYDWNYVLETGASWKGPIGTLVLALPADFNGFQGKLPEALKLLGASQRGFVYKAEGWEPTGADNLALRYGEDNAVAGARFWLDQPRELEFASVSKPELGVRVLGASSFLPDKADAYVSEGVLRQAGFGAASLFDGIRETAWAEGKTGDGIGEYVAFSLDRPMCMVAVQNGYLRSTVDLPEKATWSFFEKNNRVKSLRLERDNGELVDSFDLEDTRELQYFFVDLPAGSYRAVIGSVYPGTKWKDTCLGELRFYPGALDRAAAADSLRRLKADAFFGKLLRGE
jgi:hypothetical protein